MFELALPPLDVSMQLGSLPLDPPVIHVQHRRLDSYGIYSYGMSGYGLYGHAGPYSYGLYSYGVPGSARNTCAAQTSR